ADFVAPRANLAELLLRNLIGLHRDNDGKPRVTHREEQIEGKHHGGEPDLPALQDDAALLRRHKFERLRLRFVQLERRDGSSPAVRDGEEPAEAAELLGRDGRNQGFDTASAMAWSTETGAAAFSSGGCANLRSPSPMCPRTAGSHPSFSTMSASTSTS